jgi:hypothetical protein
MSLLSRCPLAILLLPLLVSPAAGQNRILQQRLAEARSLTCTFSSIATGIWKGDGTAVETGTTTRRVAFSDINVEDGTAESDGDFGGSLIAVRHAGDYLHLMQSHSSGPLHITTVLARETKEGRLMAVHTRHEYTDVRLPTFTSRPEMYVGECTVGGKP